MSIIIQCTSIQSVLLIKQLRYTVASFSYITVEQRYQKVHVLIHIIYTQWFIAIAISNLISVLLPKTPLQNIQG